MHPDSTVKVLERWYSLVDAGESPDIDALCDGDPELAARVRALLAQEEILASVPRSPRPTGDDDDDSRAFGPYRVTGVLGSGGMATVYMAEEPSLHRPVAIKVLHPQSASDPALRARFRREAEITAALDHKNIVPIYTVGEQDGDPYIVMKLLEGPSLAEPVTRSPREVARIGIEIAGALHAAHLSGVIHRDVKPSNVILEGDTPVLLDFGLALGLGDESLTRTGTAPGTLLYMSPEQLRGRSAVLDPRTDVYSLGATLYEACTGRPPFRSDDPTQLIEDISRRDPSPMGLPADDRDMETIVRRAMDKDRDKRFQTAAELAEDLHRFLRNEPIVSKRSGFPTRVIKLARRNRKATFTVLLLGFVILSMSAFLGAERYAHRRVFETDVERARQLIHVDGDTLRARELLESLRLRDGASRPLADLERQCTAVESFDDFFDAILTLGDRRGPYDDADLERRLENLIAAGGDLVRRPWSDCAIALARGRLGDVEDGLNQLDDAHREFGDAPAIVAVRAVLSDHQPPVTTSSHDHRHAGDERPAHTEVLDCADQHLLVATAMRLANADSGARRRQIELALEERSDHLRPRTALALLERQEGHFDKALGLFLGLSTQVGCRPSTLLHLAFTALLVGDPSLAERTLERVPESERSFRYAVMRAQILRWRGAPELLPYVEAAQARWPLDPDLTAELGYARLMSGDEAGGRDALRLCLERSPPPATRDRCRAALLSLDLNAFQQRLPELAPEAAGAEALSLLNRAGALADDATDPLAASDALLLAARVERLLGRVDSAWSTIDASLQRDPANPAARMAYALWVAEEAVNLRLGKDPTLPGIPASRRQIARAYIHDEQNGTRRGVRPVDPQHRQDAAYGAFLFAFADDDAHVAETTYRRLATDAPYYWANQQPSIHLLWRLLHRDAEEE